MLKEIVVQIDSRLADNLKTLAKKRDITPNELVSFVLLSFVKQYRYLLPKESPKSSPIRITEDDLPDYLSIF